MPQSKMVGTPEDAVGNTPAGKPLAKNTANMSHTTPPPGENDPLWEELGSTRVTAGQNDQHSSTNVGIHSPSNFTELTPSLVLGKDITTLGDFKLLRKLG